MERLSVGIEEDNDDSQAFFEEFGCENSSIAYYSNEKMNSYENDTSATSHIDVSDASPMLMANR